MGAKQDHAGPCRNAPLLQPLQRQAPWQGWARSQQHVQIRDQQSWAQSVLGYVPPGHPAHLHSADAPEGKQYCLDKGHLP